MNCERGRLNLGTILSLFDVATIAFWSLAQV